MGSTSWWTGYNPVEDIQTTPMSSGYIKGQLGGIINGPGVDTTQMDQSRQQQNLLSNMLFNTASGVGTSPGEMAVNRQVSQAQAAQAAQAATSRGANAALANRQMARTGAEIGVSGAGQAAQARAADANAAQGQLAGLLGTQRQQDMGAQQLNQQQKQLQMSALANYLGVDQMQIQNALQAAGITPDRGALGSMLQGAGGLLAALA